MGSIRPLLLLEHTPRSTLNGAILSLEKKATQKLLKTCGEPSRTTLESTLLDLIVFNRISPVVERHLSIASRSLWISQISPDTLLAAIPLFTLVDFTSLSEKTNTR